MSDVWKELLGFAGTLLGSLFGILAAQKLTQFRVGKLEGRMDDQVAKHDKLKERTTRLEGRMDAAESEISDLKQYHRPN